MRKFMKMVPQLTIKLISAETVRKMRVEAGEESRGLIVMSDGLDHAKLGDV